MEITKGVVEKFDIASVKIGPSAYPSDKMDLEIVLSHKQFSGCIISLAAITNSNAVTTACLPEGLSLTRSAEKRTNDLIKSVCELIREELI